MILFAVLAVLSKGWLEPDGQVIFDSRVLGYDLTTAQRYLDALSEAQRRLYLGTFRTLDTAFPLVLTTTLVAVVLHHWRGGQRAMRGFSICLILAYLAFDLSENAVVAQILRSEEGASQALVARASALTTSKWLMLGLALMMTLVVAKFHWPGKGSVEDA